MYRRISKVKQVDVISLTNTAIMNIGDSVYMNPRSMVLAVQREFPLFLGKEGAFEQFFTFTQPLPETPITEKIFVSTVNHQPSINVDRIQVLGASTSAIIQIGSTRAIRCEARVKHIRQLLPRDEEQRMD